MFLCGAEAVSVEKRTSHYSNHPLRKRVLQMKEMAHQQCQTQKLTSKLEQTLLGNINMDAGGGGARPLLCFYHNSPFRGNNPSVCFPRYGNTEATCLKFTLMQLHV